MTREERLGWCRMRALEYLDADGDQACNLADALTSLMSDLSKHPATTDVAEYAMADLRTGLNYMVRCDVDGLRRWIILSTDPEKNPPAPGGMAAG
jgi:hypothetical protein